MLSQHEIKQLSQLFQETKKIVITTHHHPDGDAMGSSLGLGEILKQLKHQVQVITPNRWPNFLDWMPGSSHAISAEDHPKKAARFLEEAEIIFLLDYNTVERTKQLAGLIKSSNAVKIMIDHHPEPKPDAQFMHSYTQASSTSELVYQVAEALQWSSQITKAAASCLYTGIMTDTGSFKFPSTSAETHRITADLMLKGANGSEIHRMVFDTNSIDRMRLLGYCLLEKMTLLNDYHTAFMALSAEELTRFHHKKGDTEGLVNYALSIGEIKFSAIFMEREDEIKISFRSKGSFDVNAFARKYFEGGGHKNAAGGKGCDSLDETIMKFIQVLAAHKDELIANE